MMDLLLATSGGEAQAASSGYVDGVFSAYTYTGNGSVQTINNGIDLAGKGGLVWCKKRSSISSHFLVDSARATDTYLATHNTNGATFLSGAMPFLSNGFSTLPDMGDNADTYVSWTFRCAPKFFDVVTYTGNGASNRALSHQLNADVGMIMVKATSTAGDWRVFHRSATGDLVLNTTAAQTASKANIPSATSSTFTVNGSANTNGVTYVAYLWAHDPSTEGIVQCGSFTTDGSGNATVNLGWEPQYLMLKTTGVLGSWDIFDSMRGLNVSSTTRLSANSSTQENNQTTNYVKPTSTGFDIVNGFGGANNAHIYLAIRRPNKPPTTGTQVYNAIARTGTGKTSGGTLVVSGVGFPPDVAIAKGRTGIESWANVERIRGSGSLGFSTTSGENTNCILYLEQDGYKMTQDASANWDLLNMSYINHFFRRAPGFFDVVCDTGTGVAHAVAHNLTKAPELIIRKSRSATTQWEVWHSALAATEKMVLNSNAAKVTDATAWNSTLPTTTQFTVGTGANVNTNAATYVTYLFATLAGISKVGSYTGNGTSQTINCGFSAGARFFLVKATSTTGNWWVFDSARGIVSSFDPSLALNSTAAEVTTDDSVDPDASGFIINQNTTTNINASGGQYIFLAIA